MNIKRMFDEMADDPGPPTRMDSDAAFSTAMRYRQRRHARRWLLCGLSAVFALAATAVILATTRQGPQPAEPTQLPSPVASPGATASPPITSSPTAVQPSLSPSPAIHASGAAGQLDCTRATTHVRTAIQQQGFGQELTVTCGPGSFRAKVTIVSSPVEVVLTVEISTQWPVGATVSACTGQPGRCEQSGSTTVARADGMLISVSVLTDGRSSSTSEMSPEQRGTLADTIAVGL